MTRRGNPDPLSVRCTYCNAEPGRPCMSSTGAYLSRRVEFHPARVRAADPTDE